MPDPLDLDAIEARANAATEGPWEWRKVSDYGDDHALFSGGGQIHDDGSAGGEYGPSIDVTGPDATFIAAARTDVPALVARVRELEAALREADALTSAVRQAFSLDYVAPELLPERVAMAGAALQTARADYEAVEQARRDLHRVMHMQARDITEAANEIAELRATLANERGEGKGPSEGWTFYGDNWHCTDGNGMTVERWVDAEEGFCWRAVRDKKRGQLIAGVLRFTACEAMRAADKARGAT